MSNGDRSTQSDEDCPTNYTHMFPEGSHTRIRSVSIHNNWCISGFRFIDKEGALLWKIGETDPALKVKTVALAENERIVGVVTKLDDGYQSVYTDLSFKIATRMD